MLTNDVAFTKAYQFAIDIVALCDGMTARRRGGVLTRQLIRCGTSIAANLAEANAAISAAEMSAKLSIAYKEAQEAKYWLCLLRDTKHIRAESARPLIASVSEISRIIFASLNTLRLKSSRHQNRRARAPAATQGPPD